MPTYDYVCETCGHEFEHFQSMSDKRLRRCPKCKKPALVRRVGAGAGVIFKGSGFYQTDYKNPGGSKSSDGAPSSSAASSGDAGGCGKASCAGAPGPCASTDSSPAPKPSGGSSKKKKTA